MIKLCGEGKDQRDLASALMGICRMVMHSPHPVLSPEASHLLVSTLLEQECPQTRADLKIVLTTFAVLFERLGIANLNSGHKERLAKIILSFLKLSTCVSHLLSALVSFFSQKDGLLASFLIVQGDLSNMQLLELISQIATPVKFTQQARTKFFQHATQMLDSANPTNAHPALFNKVFRPLYEKMRLRLMLELFPRIGVTTRSELQLNLALNSKYQALMPARGDMAEAMEGLVRLFANSPKEALKEEFQNSHGPCSMLLLFITTQLDYMEHFERCGAGYKLRELAQKAGSHIIHGSTMTIMMSLGKVSCTGAPAFIYGPSPEPQKRIADTFFVAGILADMPHVNFDIQQMCLIPAFEQVVRELCPNEKNPQKNFSFLASQLLCRFQQSHPDPKAVSRLMAGLGMLALSGCFKELTPPAAQAFQQLLTGCILDLPDLENKTESLFAFGALWKAKLIQQAKAQELVPSCKRIILEMIKDKNTLSPHQIRQILFFIESIEGLPATALNENEEAQFNRSVQELR